MSSPVNKTLEGLPPSGIRKFFDLVVAQKDIISLGVGEPDFITPWHIREASIYALEKGQTSYTSNLGLADVRKEISNYLTKQFSISYDPKNEILLTTGVSEAFDIAVRALLNLGDEVIVHQPCYVSYVPLITLAGGNPIIVETKQGNNFSLQANDIEQKITDKTKIIVLNYPNNPTGAILDKQELEKIASLAKKHDLLVISDDIYAELTYNGKHTSIASLPGMKERTIFLHGFSKAYAMTGFRIGYVAAPASLLDPMVKIHQYSMLCAPILSQAAALEALQFGGKEMLRMKKEFDERRKFVVSEFNKIGLGCFEPKGAFYVFPSIKTTGLSSEDFALQLLEKEKVAVVPGTAFGASGEGYIRVSYAASMDQIQEALKRIGRFVE